MNPLSPKEMKDYIHTAVMTENIAKPIIARMVDDKNISRTGENAKAFEAGFESAIQIIIEKTARDFLEILAATNEAMGCNVKH